jgi:hypothetical protein
MSTFDTLPAASWAAGPICLDDMITVIGQYPNGYYWNGFLIPAIDPLACVETLEALNASYAEMGRPEDGLAWRWLEDGRLEVTDLSTATEADGPWVETYSPDADGLYGLGAYGWTWQEDLAPEDDPYAEQQAPTEIGCYLCDSSEPMREILSSKVVNRRQDATEAYLLACGHWVI